MRPVAWTACAVLGALVALSATAHAKKAPSTTLDVQVSVPGADIVLDGVAQGRSPLAKPIQVKPGSHTVKVSKPGHAEFIDVVEVAAGKGAVVEVDLLALAAAVKVTSRPKGAIIAVDGRDVGVTPWQGELEPGTKRLQLQLEGYLDAARDVELVAGETYAIDFPLRRAPRRAGEREGRSPAIYEKWWFWAAAGAVVVGTTVLLVAVSGDDPLADADHVVRPPF
jgi:hypothetical protein